MKIGKFLSNYVRSVDVKEPIELTITSVEVEEVGTDKDEKLVLYAKELEQGVVLGSKAVLGFMAETFGDETSNWVGKKVVLYKDPNVLFQGKRVGGIRLRLPE